MMREAGTFKEERALTSAQGTTVSIKGAGHQTMINMCSNNYLGFCDDREILAAASSALESRMLGNASVRFVCGTSTAHQELEAKVAKFHGKEDAIVFSSCFDANSAIFSALFSEEDTIASDSLNHASIIDGLRLCRAKKVLFEHADVEDLRDKLLEAKESRMRAIVTDGVFSMDGDLAPLDDLREAADQADALLVVDDCHATGVLGETGRGTPEFFRVQPDIILSTFGKALGGASGGYAAASADVVSLLRNAARPYLFSNALAPPLVAAAAGAVDKFFFQPDHVKYLLDRLRDNTHRFRRGMARAGFAVSGHYDHPIAPVVVGDAVLAKQLAEDLFHRGVLVVPFAYPVVPYGEARIRCQLSAAHSTDQIDQVIQAFSEISTNANQKTTTIDAETMEEVPSFLSSRFGSRRPPDTNGATMKTPREPPSVIIL